VARCDWIVAQLMQYAGAQELVCVPMDVDRFLQGVIKGYTVPDALGSLDIQSDLAAEAMVSMDSHKMARALEALLDNARDAFAGVGVEHEPTVEIDDRVIRLTARRTDEEVEIVVEDNGPGMPSDVRERAFEPLFSTKSFGVGLGLSICRLVVENHGGRVQLHSELGQGTRVTLWLPVVAEA
jgi:signal transduction histidine kinase